MKTGVIIAAAGSSSRMGINKLMIDLGGMPVIAGSVLAFDRISETKQIVVVTPPGGGEIRPALEKISFRHRISFAEGGENRFESVRNGFMELSGCDFVAVHDGARPFVTEEDILKVFHAAEEYGAALLAVPAKETVKSALDSFVSATLPRERLYNAQTPQVFKYDIYREALDLAMKNRQKNFTDDSQLVERLGVPVKICEGSYENIKLTTPEDLYRIASVSRKEEQTIRKGRAGYENRTWLRRTPAGDGTGSDTVRSENPIRKRPFGSFRRRRSGTRHN